VTSINEYQIYKVDKGAELGSDKWIVSCGLRVANCVLGCEFLIIIGPWRINNCVIVAKHLLKLCEERLSLNKLVVGGNLGIENYERK